MSKYPVAIDEEQVGKYPALSKAGGGYFFDEVLEYRVWCHPERGAIDHYDGEDYYYSFSSYEEAHDFFELEQGTEEPLVLIKQLEWIDEPEEGKFEHLKGERITEWLPAWLSREARLPGDIENFIKEKTKG